MATLIACIFIWVMVLALHMATKQLKNMKKWLKVAMLRPAIFKECLKIQGDFICIDGDKLTELVAKEDQDFIKWVNDTK